jgi:hypothetical protein
MTLLAVTKMKVRRAVAIGFLVVFGLLAVTGGIWKLAQYRDDRAYMQQLTAEVSLATVFFDTAHQQIFGGTGVTVGRFLEETQKNSEKLLERNIAVRSELRDGRAEELAAAVSYIESVAAYLVAMQATYKQKMLIEVIADSIRNGAPTSPAISAAALEAYGEAARTFAAAIRDLESANSRAGTYFPREHLIEPDKLDGLADMLEEKTKEY